MIRTFPRPFITSPILFSSFLWPFAPRTPPSGSSEGWLLVSPDIPVEPGSRAAPGPSVQHHSALTPGQLTARYNSFEASFAPLPERCLWTCRSLTGAGSTPLARATRAWTSGLWAKLVLEDQVPTPRPASRLPAALRPRFYVVLRCEGLSCPRLFSSGRLFKEAVGSLEGSQTVCQSFASIAEAAVYCEAAGFALPSEQ